SAQSMVNSAPIQVTTDGHDSYPQAIRERELPRSRPLRSAELRLAGIPAHPLIGRHRVLPEVLLCGGTALACEVGSKDVESLLVLARVDDIVFAEDVPNEVQHGFVDRW